MVKRVYSKWPTPGDIKQKILSPNLVERPELNEYERTLIGKDLIPVSFILKNSTPKVVDLAIAEMLAEGLITILHEPDNLDFIIPLRPDREKPPREGRYPKALTPEEYDTRYKGTRKALTVLALRRDRHLLYYLGNSHIGNGLQLACRFVREHLPQLRAEHQHVSRIGKEAR